MTEPERTPLTRAAVLVAALGVADAEGLEAVSFRRLAAELGVTPMALYRYVDGKDDLLAGMADLVLAGVEVPDDPRAGLWERLEASARSFRRALLAHPAAVPIVTSRPLLTTNGLRASDRVIGVFRDAGFPLEQAVVVYAQFVRFLSALVALETGSGPPRSGEERVVEARSLRNRLETLPSQEFPNLVEAAGFLASPYDPEGMFETGLALLLAGVERLRETSGEPRFGGRPPGAAPGGRRFSAGS